MSRPTVGIKRRPWWRESGTWNGVGGMVASFGPLVLAIPPAAPAAPVIAAVAGVCFAAGAFLREGPIEVKAPQ